MNVKKPSSPPESFDLTTYVLQALAVRLHNARLLKDMLATAHRVPKDWSDASRDYSCRSRRCRRSLVLHAWQARSITVHSFAEAAAEGAAAT
jgi:hypothetical protein